MSLEVEQKFHVTDRPALERTLVAVGAVQTASIDQQDIYLVHPSRDMAATDEAFRIRTDSNGTLLCYKGPRKPGPVKIREEIEILVPDEDLENLRRMLAQLGFCERATVKKHRVTWQMPRPDSQSGTITVALDTVEQLGEFAEVELVVDENEADQASQTVTLAGASLGLDRLEPRSYIAMLVKKIDRSKA